jgi:hypothetical protein
MRCLANKITASNELKRKKKFFRANKMSDKNSIYTDRQKTLGTVVYKKPETAKNGFVHRFAFYALYTTN